MEPISRKEFQAANESVVKSIKGHIDDKFETHQKFEDARYKILNKSLGEHNSTLYGEPGSEAAVGLRMKVDRLNTWAKAAMWVAAAVITLGASYLGLT